jgi:hypothetical protein
VERSELIVRHLKETSSSWNTGALGARSAGTRRRRDFFTSGHAGELLRKDHIAPVQIFSATSVSDQPPLSEHRPASHGVDRAPDIDLGYHANSAARPPSIKV